MRHGAHRLPTPLARPRASPSASARCALRLRASRGGFTASGAPLSSGLGAKEGGDRVLACPPRPRAHPCGCTRSALARVLAHYLCKRFRPFGARARVGFWVVYNRRWAGGYLCALVKLAPRAQVKLPSAVKPASQVKFAFFRKNARCPCGAPPPAHPLGAPARLAFGIGALRLAPSRKGAASPPRARLCPRGWVQRKGKIAYLPVPRARGRILADAPAARLHACLRTTCASAFAPSGRGRAKVFGWYITEDRI